MRKFIERNIAGGRNVDRRFIAPDFSVSNLCPPLIFVHQFAVHATLCLQTRPAFYCLLSAAKGQPGDFPGALLGRGGGGYPELRPQTNRGLVAQVNEPGTGEAKRRLR